MSTNPSILNVIMQYERATSVFEARLDRQTLASGNLIKIAKAGNRIYVDDSTVPLLDHVPAEGREESQQDSSSGCDHVKQA
jgi:hypothetical protein